MDIWVNKVGGDSRSEFKIEVVDGIRDVNDLRKAINASVECAKAPERFGSGAVDIYTDMSAAEEYILSARDTLFSDGQLKWSLLFFAQPAQPAAFTGQPTIDALAAAVTRKLSISELSVTSAAVYYKRLSDTKAITVACDCASDFNIDLIVSYAALMDNISEFFYCPQMNQSEHEVQLWWNGLDWSFWDRKMTGRKFTTFCEDTHSHPLENNRKPDCSHIAKGCVKSMYTVVVLNDLKLREGMFNADDKGKVIDLSKAFYDAQGPMRSGGLTSYLCDGDKIMFFLYSNGAVLESAPMELSGLGGLWLLSLLTTDIERLGYCLPKIKVKGSKLEIREFLGQGYFNNAFLGADGRVIRQTKNRSQVSKREIAVHQHVTKAFTDAGKGQNIVHILTVSDCGTALIESPACKIIATPIQNFFLSREQLHQVINIGAALKSAKCVHLDLRPSNFLLHGDTVVLSDLGSAVLLTDRATFPASLSGTTKYGSPGMLQHLIEGERHEPCLADDYHSIIRVIYVSVVRGAYEQLHAIAPDDSEGITTFWRAALNRPLWEECVGDAAMERCNYEELRVLVESCACNASGK